MATMETEIINDIADKLSQQYDYINDGREEHKRTRFFQLRDDTIAMAIVVAKYAPDYDIHEFYTRAGYVGTHPEHARV